MQLQNVLDFNKIVSIFQNYFMQLHIVLHSRGEHDLSLELTHAIANVRDFKHGHFHPLKLIIAITPCVRVQP